MAHGNGPPGRIKLIDSLRGLLETKEFSAITTAEIADRAGVTEALIYKHFSDKRGLLHHILACYMIKFIENMNRELSGVTGALNRLSATIKAHLDMYANNRVFARILIIEVRNHHDYFNSQAYGIVREYAANLRGIIEEGQATGEIRKDIGSDTITRIVLGAIEHSSLPWALFSVSMNPDEICEQLRNVFVKGFAP
jgi:AcrR family transcriptional regulator